MDFVQRSVLCGDKSRRLDPMLVGSGTPLKTIMAGFVAPIRQARQDQEKLDSGKFWCFDRHANTQGE